MTEKKCARCGDRAQTIDNLIGSTFWGLIQKETTVTTAEAIRFRATYIRQRSSAMPDSVMRVDDSQDLCGDCWGLLVGHFMQGRAVPSLAKKGESVREMSRRLAGEDRDQKSRLVNARRDGYMTQADVAALLGVDEEWVREFEKYDYDPLLSDLRRYETAVATRGRAE